MQVRPRTRSREAFAGMVREGPLLFSVCAVLDCPRQSRRQSCHALALSDRAGLTELTGNGRTSFLLNRVICRSLAHMLSLRSAARTTGEKKDFAAVTHEDSRASEARRENEKETILCKKRA